MQALPERETSQSRVLRCNMRHFPELWDFQYFIFSNSELLIISLKLVFEDILGRSKAIQICVLSFLFALNLQSAITS